MTVPSSGLPYYPQVIPTSTFLGRLSSNSGPVEPITRLAMLAALGIGPGNIRVFRDAGDCDIATTDTFVVIRRGTPAATTVNFPASSTFLGMFLWIKDGTGDAATNNITNTPNGSEKIDTLSTVVINGNYGDALFAPDPDGGWLLMHFG